MKIIVCGAGMVGNHIARYLADEQNEVTVIDMNAEVVRKLTDQFNMRGVVGFASHPNVLEEAGARDADMIIAATHSDEVNMVICQIAHSIFDITDKIARLRSDAYTNAIYADMYRRDHMPVDVVISPEIAVAEALARRLRKSAAFDHQLFLEGDAVFVGIEIDEECPIVHTPLSQLQQLFSTFHGKVVAIRREGKLFTPERDDQLFVDDEVYLITTRADENRAYEIFGKELGSTRHVVMIGGGEIGYQVAKILEEEGATRLKIIERDRARAEFLADNLDKTVVLHGDGLDSSILKEANIASANVVISVTDDDKINLLAGARGKAMGATRSVALVNDTTLDDLAVPLNIDTIVNPRTITVSSILQHIRHGRIHSVYVVGENESEVIEAQVLASSSIAGSKIKDIQWPPNAMVGAVKKGDEVIIPDGETRLNDADWLVIYAPRNEIEDLERLFQVTIDYF